MRTHRKTRIGALLLACALGVSAAVLEPGQQQRFSIPGHGNLVLNIPTGWRVASNSLQEPPAVSLRIGPASGDAFSIQVSTVWIDPAKASDLSPESFKERMQQSAAELLPKSVEKEARVMELRGKESTGYYFSLTDKESTSAPGDYKYMTQGTAVTGRLVTVFTILQHDLAPSLREQALRLFTDATYSRAEAVPAGDPESQTLRIDESDRGYRLSVPVSRLVLTIPRGGLTRASDRAGGAANSPRYFHFTDEKRQLQVSGWFEHAQKFAGVKNFWAEETAQWRRNNLPEPRDVSFTKIGGWDAIAYEVPAGAGTSSHIRGHWVQSETWIDLHLSITSDRPASESRTALVAFLETLDVSQK